MTRNTTPKPKEVQLAIRWLYISLALAVFQSLRATGLYPATGIIAVYILFIGLAINWVFIFMIEKRYNWARILWCAGFVMVTVSALLKWAAIPVVISPVSRILNVIQIITQFVACVYLFQPQSNTWFKNKPNPTEKAGAAEAAPQPVSKQQGE